MLTVEEFAKHLDLAYLAPNLQKEDIIEACNIAKKYHVNAVNVNSCWGELVVNELKGTDVGPSAVIGFPYGAMSTKSKLFELQEMVDLGCTACDMVVNIGALKDGDYDLVRHEISEFVRICGDTCDTKLIFEVGFLTDEEIAALTKICCECGVTYVKTATGISDGTPGKGHEGKSFRQYKDQGFRSSENLYDVSGTLYVRTSRSQPLRDKKRRKTCGRIQ